MISWTSFFTILGMAAITYSTRLLGFFLLKNRQLTPKMVRVLDAMPACVLLSVIAPHFVSGKPHEFLAMMIIVWAAWRWTMLPTVLIAVSSSTILGWIIKQMG